MGKQCDGANTNAEVFACDDHVASVHHAHPRQVQILYEFFGFGFWG